MEYIIHRTEPLGVRWHVFPVLKPSNPSSQRFSRQRSYDTYYRRKAILAQKTPAEKIPPAKTLRQVKQKDLQILSSHPQEDMSPAMKGFSIAQRNIIGNNRFIVSSRRPISQPIQISEDATAQPLSMTPEMWTQGSSTQMQAFHTTDNENPVLNSQEAWNERHDNFTINPASTLLTVEINQAVEALREMADMSTSFVSNMEYGNLRKQFFHQRLHLWIERLEDRFVRDVCGWALRYAPEKPIFGLVTDFSRANIMRVYRKSRCMTKEDIVAFKEMLIALRMWAYGGGVEMEPMSPQEAGGSTSQGICNLATICVIQGAWPLTCPIMERRTVWTEIMELTMERGAGSMKMEVSAMIFNMLEDVLPKWKYDIDMKKQMRRARVINQFIREPTF